MFLILWLILTVGLSSHAADDWKTWTKSGTEPCSPLCGQGKSKVLYTRVCITSGGRCKGPKSKYEEVDCFGTRQCPETHNWALEKPAFQSSVEGNYGPELAVDGSNESTLSQNSCSHIPESDIHPWWMVDLETSVTVTAVGILNRGDCCGDKFRDFYIEVQNDRLGRHAKLCHYQKLPIPKGHFSLFKCQYYVRGRYVRISKHRREFTLCEVTVRGYTKSLDNLALGKPATQSSDHKEYGAWRAVDGFNYTLFADKSCTHTASSDKTPWWMVDLEYNVSVSQIAVYLRSDCCAETHTNLNFEVLTKPDDPSPKLCHFQRNNSPQRRLVVIQCPDNPRGRYVRIRRAGSVLTLCEVFVRAFRGAVGGWSPWQRPIKSKCDAVCGVGSRKLEFHRTCTSPPPGPDGAPCVGINFKTKMKTCIGKQRCPVDGEWASWVEERKGSCDAICGRGSQKVFYKRSCSNPEPDFGGKNCEGRESKIMNSICVNNSSDCPEDGGWSMWTETKSTECDATCGAGSRTAYYSRQCNNPTPTRGGQPCEGETVKQMLHVCPGPFRCPVHGGWGAWANVLKTHCTVTCGESGTFYVHSERYCEQPKPRYSGLFCRGDKTKMVSENCRPNVKCQVSEDESMSPVIMLVIAIVLFSLFGAVIYLHRRRRKKKENNRLLNNMQRDSDIYKQDDPSYAPQKKKSKVKFTRQTEKETEIKQEYTSFAQELPVTEHKEKETKIKQEYTNYAQELPLTDHQEKETEIKQEYTNYSQELPLTEHQEGETEIKQEYTNYSQELPLTEHQEGETEIKQEYTNYAQELPLTEHQEEETEIKQQDTQHVEEIQFIQPQSDADEKPAGYNKDTSENV